MVSNLHFNPEDVVGKECKSVAYSTDAEKQNDLVVIKEVVHTKDGRQIPRLVLRENVKRPIFVTREGPSFRNHQEKKEFELREKCVEYHTTDVKMSQTIQMALGHNFPNPKLSLKMACRSPFVYWADLPVTSWIKQKYKEKYPNAQSLNRSCVFDVETKEDDGSKRMEMVSFVCDKEIHFFAHAEYFDRIKGGHEAIEKKTIELLSRVPFTKNKKGKKLPKGQIEYRDLIKENGYELFVHRCATPAQCIVAMFHEVHRLLPDLLVAWNIDYDLTIMMKELDAEGIPYEDVFCHPDVPHKYRNVWYKRDQASKKTESKTLTKSPADQWHVLYCQASFYAVDAMCLFKKIRTHEGNRPTYRLSAILETEVGVGKLDIPGLEYKDNVDWHIQAQRDFPLEYCAYNIMDNLLIVLLDEQTNDLSSALSILSGVSMYDIFPSLPKRICNEFTYFLWEQGLVIGSVGNAIKNDFDEEVIGTDGWIVTLPAHMNAENGLHVVKEVPSLLTAFRGQTADADLTQAYPSCTNMANQSRETTIIELISIEGVSEEVRRRAGVNLTAGRVNAMEIANELFLMPDKDVVLEAFLKRMNAANEEVVTTIDEEAA